MRMWLAIIGLGLLVGCSGPALRPADRWVARNGGVCEPAGDRMTRLSGRFDAVISKPIKLIVLDRSDLRAYSFPSGEVIVTRGLIAALSDDELTAVIGHEVGHLLRGGHRQAPTALTGQPKTADTESAADDASVQLLTAMNLPTTAMRSSLEKVLASLPPDSTMRPAIAARIARLP
jgi:hypothetical protein